jgi:hypothetical protein
MRGAASGAIYVTSIDTAQGAAVQRTTAGDEPPNMHGKSNGTAQGAVVQRPTSSGTAKSVEVQRAGGRRSAEDARKV